MPNDTAFILIDQGTGGYRLLSVPAHIARDARAYQMQFDKWLTAPQAGHNYWHIGPDGTPALRYDGAEAFVKWLNEFVLDASEAPACVVPTLYF